MRSFREYLRQDEFENLLLEAIRFLQRAYGTREEVQSRFLKAIQTQMRKVGRKAEDAQFRDFVNVIRHDFLNYTPEARGLYKMRGQLDPVDYEEEWNQIVKNTYSFVSQFIEKYISPTYQRALATENDRWQTSHLIKVKPQPAYGRSLVGRNR